MPKSSELKPEPVIVKTICSLCDEPWELHGDNPTTLDCIRLLKARPTTVIQQAPTIYPWPTTINVPYQPLQPLRPWYDHHITCQSSVSPAINHEPSVASGAITSTNFGTVRTEYRTPEIV
jgi:hypothetical protein